MKGCSIISHMAFSFGLDAQPQHPVIAHTPNALACEGRSHCNPELWGQLAKGAEQTLRQSADISPAYPACTFMRRAS